MLTPTSPEVFSVCPSLPVSVLGDEIEVIVGRQPGKV